MTKRDDVARKHRLDALSLGEQHVRVRLHTLRVELADLIHVIDRAVMPPRRPAMRADGTSTLALPGLVDLTQHRCRRRK
jgi:hypothetical protein